MAFWKFWSRPRAAAPSHKEKPAPLYRIKTYLSNGKQTTSSSESGITSANGADMSAPPRKHTVSGGKPCVVMPLYIYPLPGKDSWQPLYDAIAAHPQVDFLIVVNPNSGPGEEPLPSTDYMREVPKLNAFPNVTTVGYIAITWARKSLDDVKKEIDRYAGWDQKACQDLEIEGLYLEGIYLDETPNHVSEHAKSYLKELTGYVKGLEGLRGERLVIHNPGTPPEGPLSAFGSPDLVCVSEEPHHRYIHSEVQSRIETYSLPHDKTLFQVSGVPLGHVAATTKRILARSAAQGSSAAGNGARTARYIFVTDLEKDFYESFGESWGCFVRTVAEVVDEEGNGGKKKKKGKK
ncbi:cell surface protein [Rhypophila decipiens]|uniref:Cell surface protein n=1 Tax=Rhypophila decipiens TaxID=261697 RepID=A0AAN6YFR4_9PEZI|nr:cell surface protein [Rhypophila decipiens]